MARKERRFEIGGIYYITQKGIDNRRIFLDKEDYFRFITAIEFFNCRESINLWSSFFCKKRIRSAIYKERLKNNKRKRVVDFLSFLVTPKGYVFIIREIEEGGISFFMKKMGGYVCYFNKKYKRKGPLFCSRYNAMALSKEEAKKAFCYMYIKPVTYWRKKEISKQEIKEKLYNSKYSSLSDYIGNFKNPSVTNRGFFLELFKGRRGVREEIEKRLDKIT